MSDKFIGRIDKALGIIMKGTILLLPLFFLPWTSEAFEFNKQFLLWLLMPVAALLWLYKAIAEGQVKIKINPLNLPILIFLLLTAVASIFGLDRFSSFFGHFGRFSDAWLGLLSLIIFYFLIINTEVASGTEKIISLLKLLLYSSFAVAIVSLSAILGWLSVISGDPLSIFSSVSFNPAGGSLFSLAVWLAVMSIVLASFLFNGGLRKFDRIFFSVCLAIFLITLGLINFSLSWALIIIGAGLMIFFRWLAEGFNFKKILNYYLLIPAVLILLSTLMFALSNLSLTKLVLGQDLPREDLLTYEQSWIVAKEAFKKNPGLGSGLGTFQEDFSRYRPAELNSGAFWQIRFLKSRSYFLEILATAGLPTLLSYFLIICLVIYLNIILIKKYLGSEPASGTDENYNLITALFTVFVLIFFSQLGFLTNTVLNFIFWFYLALIIAFWQRVDQPLFKERIIDLKKTVLSYRLAILILFILSVGVFTLLVFETKFFVADLIATSRLDREAGLTTAIKLNPYRYNYRLSLAKFYLNQAGAEALKPAEKKDNTKIQLDITRAIAMAQPALTLAPNSVLTQETMGMIYRDIRQLTLGSEPWAVKYFSDALNLEPTNPVLATELAKAYSNLNDSANAEKYFRRGLELKPDYYEAKLGLAKTYLKNKQDNQALILLNELAREVQTAEIYYELGRFYYNHGEVDKAIDRFKLALNLSPKYANSLYSLAVAYEAKGERAEALKYYQQVLELNPGNAEVKKKLEELSK